MAVKKPGMQDRELVEEWRGVLALHARTVCALDRALHPFGLGASDFEVLDVLAGEAADAAGQGSPANGGECAFRVQEIADRVHLSQSALSRLVGRLERDGLVTRGMCEKDRRGVRVVLTRKGRDLHSRVLPEQRAVLERMLTGKQI
ncbi:MarR family winged helix-turn-helix transcriptional regulator [Streptomyces sp. NPDC004111]|uniref:MarR family winged helix-turn-helix transcriptional regulator n=1 Tax=Streptomyces sp. NPDC004111 TaxID=3364690 RepID=UPI0036B05405